MGPNAPQGVLPRSIQLLHLDQPRIPMYRRAAPCVGWGSCLQPDLWLNTEDGKERGVWITLVMEEGTFWYVGEGW